MAAEQPQLYFYADQYNNPANWQAHYLTTGPGSSSRPAGRSPILSPAWGLLEP
jgi:cysteine synthase